MKFKFNAVCAALVLAAVAVPSFAKGKDKDRDDDKHGGREISSVPEINGAGASLALALLGGMVLIGRERRRNR